MKTRFDLMIFDLDGTLADTFPDVSAGINHAVRKMGRPELTEEQMRSAIGPGGDEFIRAVLQESGDSDKKVFLEFFREYYDIHCLDSTLPFSGIRDVLSSLSSVCLTVATNKPRNHAKKILSGLNLDAYFKAVCTPDNGVKEKPDPEMLFSLLDTFGVEPHRVLLVGDTERDITAGRRAGVKVCGVKYGYGDSGMLQNLKPDYLIDSPAELLDIVLHSSNLGDKYNYEN
ncbi:HAD-IA family hydrolase [bacterium]|nr:HAD-IA family hydrolase [bacterium]